MQNMITQRKLNFSAQIYIKGYTKGQSLGKKHKMITDGELKMQEGIKSDKNGNYVGKFKIMT